MTSRLRLVPAVLLAVSSFVVGCVDSAKDAPLVQKPKQSQNALSNCLQSNAVVSAVSWNGKAVTTQTRDGVLALLIKQIQSFRHSDRDCRVPVNGPMAQLAPSRTITFRLEDGKRVEVSLFVFDAKHRILQARILSPDSYWLSTEAELIDQIDAMNELK